MPNPITARLAQLVDADPRTRKEIAEAAGMSPAQLGNILLGRVAEPQASTVLRILTALGKTWKHLDTKPTPAKV